MYICDKCGRKTNTIYAMDGMGRSWFCEEDWLQHETPARIGRVKSAEGQLQTFKSEKKHRDEIDASTYPSLYTARARKK